MSNMKAEYVDHMGDDLRVVNAARVSFNKESYLVEDCPCLEPGNKECSQTCEFVLSSSDARLIRYLAKHGHFTPFTHCMITMREKVPIFVARERFRHTVGFSYNEVSRRYVDDEPEFYHPEVWRSRPVGNVKQGSGLENLSVDGVKCCENCGEKLSFLRKEDEKMKRFCSRTCQNKYYRSYTDDGWAAIKHTALRKSAEKRGIDFNLSKDHLKSLRRPSKCKYLGIPLVYDNQEIKENSPSVNRIDPSKGYIDGNVEIISQKANTVFHTLTYEEFKSMSESVILRKEGLFTRYTTGVEDFYEECKTLYKNLIEGGMAPEQARMFMPQAQLTEYYVTGSLAAWARAYKLRIDKHAQKEIQELAGQWNDIIEPLFPVSWKELIK